MFTKEEKKRLLDLGRSRQCISYWERRRSIPSVKTRRQLASLLGISTRELTLRYLEIEERVAGREVSVPSRTAVQRMPQGPEGLLL
jgi:transcriptional regulator with XRE-family HTH domain